MDWLTEAAQKADKNLEKIQEIIKERVDYRTKVEDLCDLCKDLKTEELKELLVGMKKGLENWENGPTLGLNSPAAIITEAGNYKKALDELIKKINEIINQELFPC